MDKRRKIAVVDIHIAASRIGYLKKIAVKDSQRATIILITDVDLILTKQIDMTISLCQLPLIRKPQPCAILSLLL